MKLNSYENNNRKKSKKEDRNVSLQPNDCERRKGINQSKKLRGKHDELKIPERVLCGREIEIKCLSK